MSTIGSFFATTPSWPFVWLASSSSELAQVSHEMLTWFLGINIFKHECDMLKEQLLVLGDKIIDSLDSDKIEKVFHDTDFRDRTLLKIITMNSFG